MKSDYMRKTLCVLLESIYITTIQTDNMKRYFILLSSLMIDSISIQAQVSLTAERNGIRNGDIIMKQRTAYTGASQKGNDVVWDFSMSENMGDPFRATYWNAAARGHALAKTERKASSYYEHHGDTLMMTGQENNMTRIHYAMGIPLLRYPMAMGDSIGGYYHGYAVDCENIYLRIFGYSISKVDAMGTLILPSNDTLQNVLRVHTKNLFGMKRCEDVKTESQLSNLTSNIHPFTTDSVVAYLQDTLPQMEEHTYLWYAQGYRYPVMETTSLGYTSNKEIYAATYYYSPSEQEYLANDPTNENVRAVMGKSMLQQATLQFGEIKGMGSFVDNGFTYHVVGPDAAGQLLVECRCASPTDVLCGLYTASGAVTGIVQHAENVDVAHSFKMDMSGLASGVYLLAFSVNGQAYSEKVAWKR